MKITTEAYAIQSDEEHYDVECCAQYEIGPRVWKRRVWLDKIGNEIVESDIIEYSAHDADGFKEIDWQDVPKDIRDALDGRVDAAKDDILAPLMEENKPKRLPSIESGQVQLEIVECPCGYHMGIDATFLEQVGDFVTKCPSCGRGIRTSEVLPA